ncbi:hypothetical protein [Planktotalea sp.]|uniref:hypothetical protein n=1 Tax=Planktotalea sp. TaxID=2029877 RepID=UPI003D6AE96F
MFKFFKRRRKKPVLNTRGVPADPVEFAQWSIRRHADSNARRKIISGDTPDHLVPEIAELADDLKTLEIRHSNIADISNIGALKELEELTLNASPIANLGPLKSLKCLKSLRLANLSEQCIATLPDIPSLVELNIMGCTVSQLGGPTSFPNLRKLDLSLSTLTTPTALVGKDCLTVLRIGELPSGDLQWLRGKSALEEFSLKSSEVDDIAPLAALARLTTANLYLPKVRDLAPIAALTNLRDLTISVHDLADSSALSALHKLEKFRSGRDSRLASLAWVSACKELNSLSASLQSKVSLTPLKPLQKLAFLHFDLIGSIDLTPLGNLKSLKRVSFSSPDPDATISSFPDLSALERLMLSGVGFKSLNGLEEAKSLEFLSIRNTMISDLSAVARHSKLAQLDLVGSKVDDLAVLKTLPVFLSRALEAQLHLADTPILLRHPELAPLAASTSMRDGQIFANELAIKAVSL